MKIKLFILILLSILCINNTEAQKNNKKITITGTVVDASKGPIANAIIMIDGEKTNSLTDAEGKYKVKVKPTALKIGFFTFGNGIKEEPIDGRTEINIAFGTTATQQATSKDVADGEQGVDVGYGYVKKKNLTTDVRKIDGTNKKYGTYSTLAQMVQREVSGVKVNGNTVVIRDSKDLFGSISALIVVDGVPMDALPDISPSVVKSIEVLKAADAAIYGSRGFGGVILIKTKTENN
jgi:TonB-dependent starch-binding outer membrane protein SusC